MKLNSNINFYKLPHPIWICCIALLSMLSACTKDFNLYNTNKNSVTKEQLTGDNLNLTIFYTQIQKNIIPFGNNATEEVNNYQLAESLQADAWAGYTGVTRAFGGPNNTNYFFKTSWIPQAFNNLTKSVLPAWKVFKDNYDADPNNVSIQAAFAIADIMKVYAVSRTVDMYGALPYLQFGKSTFATPYDSQEAIYTSMFKDLETDIKLIDNFLVGTGGTSPTVATDLIYGGNYKKWIQFANTLRLRLAIRTSYVTPNIAQQQAEAAVANTYGLIEQIDNNAIAKSTSQFAIINPINYIMFNYNDTRIGATIESLLNGYKDPRIAKIINESTSADNPGYHGIRTGINISNEQGYADNFSTANIPTDGNVKWITAPESYFLRAEGALRGWNMGAGDAKSFYEKGVQSSFDAFGVGSASQYLLDDASTAAPYTDYINSKYNILKNSPLLSKITIKWDDAANMETKLEKIITQKYIALFPDGQEAWSEFRRTAYPKIFPVDVNNSAGTINTAVQIRRVAYPPGENTSNPSGYGQALADLNGADNGGTKLWWDKK